MYLPRRRTLCMGTVRSVTRSSTRHPSTNILGTGTYCTYVNVNLSLFKNLDFLLLEFCVTYFLFRVVHQGLKSFVCEICKKGFVAKSNLDNHMWQHKNQRLRPFKCKLCSKAIPVVLYHFLAHGHGS